MAQVIYGIIADHGDGSSGMRWFRNKETVDELLDDDSPEVEVYGANEGSPAETLTFPDDFDLEKAGFYFSDDDDDLEKDFDD